MVYVRHKEWSYIKCFQFTFTALSTIGLGDYFPQFKNSADYSLVLRAFAWAVRDLYCACCAVPARKERKEVFRGKKNGNNNEQLPCNGNEIMVEAYNDGKKGDLNNSLLKTGDSTNQDDVPISGSRKTVLRKKQLWKANSVKVQLALEYIYLLNKIGYWVLEALTRL